MVSLFRFNPLDSFLKAPPHLPLCQIDIPKLSYSLCVFQMYFIFNLTFIQIFVKYISCT